METFDKILQRVNSSIRKTFEICLEIAWKVVVDSNNYLRLKIFLITREDVYYFDMTWKTHTEEDIFPKH